MLDAGVLSAVVVSGGAFAVAFVTNRQNRRGADATSALSERVVDREDFDAVMTRMQFALDRADKRITDLETRLEVEVEAREKAEARAVEAERRADAAEKRATRLERRVTQLEQVLREHNIEVPPLPPVTFD